MAQGELASSPGQAQATGATLIFVDESGFSLIPVVRHTWAPIGKTPVLKHRASWPKLSAISGVTITGELYMQLYHGTINAERVVRFLASLLRLVPGPIIVLWDNIGIHRAKLVQQWLERHSRLRVQWLPAYAPELNPDEGFWSHIKNKDLANYCPQDLEQLEAKVRRSRRAPGTQERHRPRLLHSNQAS